jgi:CRP-like cAMP-binding protein
MSFELILNNIGRYAQLTPEEQEEFCSLLSTRVLKKKEYLLREGEVCLYESFINKGCLRTFYIDKTGLEHNFYFGVEGWWMSDIDSRTSGNPSFCNIIAVEDTEILQITQTSLEQFLKKVPRFERFFRISYQNSIAGHQTKFLHMLHMTAEERYSYFRKKYPEFDKRIAQKHIATFLGLTPEFFNTVRSKVLRKSK